MLSVTVSAGLVAYAWACRRRRIARDDKESGNSDSRATEPRSETLQEKIADKRKLILRILAGDANILGASGTEVRHLMTAQVTKVLPRTAAQHVVDLMCNKRLRHLLVCDEKSRLLGIISDRDVHGRSGSQALDIMTANPMTVAQDTPIQHALAVMLNNHISCLPVVQDGRMCGILTSTDLMMTLQCYLRLFDEIGRGLRKNATADRMGRSLVHNKSTSISELVDSVTVPNNGSSAQN